MAIRDVTNLRKEGRLKEAYDLARQELNEDSNEWTRMSLFWVLRDFALNVFIPAHNMEQARICLDQMENLLPDMMDDNGAGEKAFQNLYKQILPNANEIKLASELSKTDPNAAYKNITEKFGTDGHLLDPKLHEDYGWIIYRYMKANSDQLTSVQIRCLLRDYMLLQNERPSLIHSMILNYAMNFSKGHPDFSFYKFFVLWGAANLRYSDYEDSRADGHEIPSLVSRICKTIVESEEQFDVSDFVSKFLYHGAVSGHLRQAYFWKLMNLHKEKRFSELWQNFDKYADDYSCLGASLWHSEILKIANRFMVDEDSHRFIPFVMNWDGSGNFRDEDWKKETNDEGVEFPSLAVKTAKKCFDILKASSSELFTNNTLTWLKKLYEKVKQNDPCDDWNTRNYATICQWKGDIDEAITIYKSLLLNMGDKYYLWSELSGLISQSKDIKIGLLLKAKKIERNEDFLGDIHLELASLWQAEGYAAIANQELEAYITHRKAKGWSISDRFDELQTKVSEGENRNNLVDFNEYVRKAEDYVYSEFDWIDFALTEKWSLEGVERCNLYASSDLTFTIKTNRFPILKKAEIGEILQFKCNIIEETQPDPKSSLWMRRTITVKRVVPLVTRKSDKEPWSILPIKYGVIDYVNESKKILHIITQDSKLTFSEYKGEHADAGSFVKFREFEDKHNEEIRPRINNVESCLSEEALPYMKSRIVVVDDVNNAKKLFHVVLGPKKISDIVRFDQTDIRPSIGDFLRITYCVKKNKEGKKHIKFLDIQKTDEEFDGVKKIVQGRLEVKFHFSYDDEPDFAFVKDYYVHGSLLKKYHITDDCDVIAKVVLGGDDKWKVYDLEILK